MIAQKTYYVVFGALLALTLATTAAAFVDLGARWNTIVGLTIAVVKALLVATYFMHLRHSQRLTLLFAGAGVLWLALLMTFVFADLVEEVLKAALTTPGKPSANGHEAKPAKRTKQSRAAGNVQ